MLLLVTQCVILTLITATVILQMIVLLGDFPGLRSSYIMRIDLTPVPGSTNALLDQLKKLYFTTIPDYFTISTLRLCGNYRDDPSKDVCSPPSMGFRYRSADELLDTFATQIPSTLHSELAGIQGGVFIVSVILCFLLLVYYGYHQHAERHLRFGGLRIALCLMFVAVVLLFSVATFAIQIVIYRVVEKALDDLKSSLFGSIFSEFVQIGISKGASVWLSMVSFILLLIVFSLLLLTMCYINKKEQSMRSDNEMRQVQNTE